MNFFDFLLIFKLKVQYHKIPKKTSSTHELSKKSRKEKKKNKLPKVSKNRKKSQEKINDEEFRKLEEHVKFKFPELFVIVEYFSMNNKLKITSYVIFF